MLHNHNIIKNFLILIFLFSLKFNISAADQDISAVKAMQLFDKKEFTEAEKMFRQLLKEDNDNTFLNYYYGACRTENGHFTDDDLNYLKKAGEKVSPQRINYYLGIQYHARGEWEKALKFYNQFRQSAPENELQEPGLTDKIQQCYDQVNPYSKKESILKAQMLSEQKESRSDSLESKVAAEVEAAKKSDKEYVADEDHISEIPKDTLSSETNIEYTFEETKEKPAETAGTDNINLQRRALPDLPGVKPTVDLTEEKSIDFQINSQITYLFASHFKTSIGRELYNKLESLQKQLETTIKQAEQLREKYVNSADPEEKSVIGKKIIELENISYRLKEEIITLSADCRNAENSYWAAAGETEKNNFLLEMKKIKTAQDALTRQKEPEPETVDTPIIITPERFLTSQELKTMRSSASTQPDLIYKIQIGAYSRGLPSYIKRLYNKLSLIRKIENYTDEEGVIVYTTGNLTNYEDALKMRNQIKQEGVKDPHVVPYFKGKRITLERAKEIEVGK